MLSYKVNDKIKIYKKSFFLHKINKVMIGTIEKIEEWKELDICSYIEHDCYKITIAIDNKKIIIKDNYKKILFCRYEIKIYE